MDNENKEQAKRIFGFKSVPFYVVVDETGSIQQFGNQRSIDFDEVPGVVRPEPLEEEKKEDDLDLDFELDLSNQEPKPAEVDRVFNMDDLDF